MAFNSRNILLFIFIPVFLSFEAPQEIKPVKILQEMIDSIRNIRTLRVNIAALERDMNSFRSAVSEIKLQTNPRKIYFKNPSKKIEILFNSGKSDNKALVKNNTFPYMTITLDPLGNLMRKNQHYTIHELGFDFVARAISFIMAKDKEGSSNFKYYGKVMKGGRQCFLIEYDNKNFAYIDYITGEHETVNSISNKLGVNEYLVRYKNDLLNDYDYLKKGRVIKVPVMFCKKATLYVDEKLRLPVSASLSDNIGIFENYEFTKIEVNKPIKEEEFTKEYKDYHF